MVTELKSLFSYEASYNRHLGVARIRVAKLIAKEKAFQQQEKLIVEISEASQRMATTLEAHREVQEMLREDKRSPSTEPVDVLQRRKRGCEDDIEEQLDRLDGLRRQLKKIKPEGNMGSAGVIELLFSQ